MQGHDYAGSPRQTAVDLELYLRKDPRALIILTITAPTKFLVIQVSN